MGPRSLVSYPFDCSLRGIVGGLNRKAADSEPVALTTRDAADVLFELGSRRGPDAGSLNGSR